MRLNPSWFSTNLLGQAAWYANFNAQAQATGTNFNLVQAELDQIKDDNNIMQFLASAVTTLDAFKDAFKEYRRIITEGDIGDPTPDQPGNLALSFPAAVPTGIFERIHDYRERIMGAANFTNETGELYGIIGTTPAPPTPDSVKPTIETFPAAMGYMFSVVVANRAESDQWEVWTMKKGGSWTKHGTYTGKSADVTVSPTNDGDAEQIQARVQLIKKNSNYGQPSDPAYVTVNP